MNTRKPAIFILGDSWAESMWRIEGTDTLVNGHIHGILEKHGYRVYNFGFIGEGNLKSWTYMENFIDGSEEAIFNDSDLVIWFHAEILRDYKNNMQDIWQNNKEWMFQSSIKEAANESYGKIKKIIEKYKINNIMLIEGQAPVVQPEFSEYIPDPVYTVNSWRNKLLNMPDLPETQNLLNINIFEFGKNLDSAETKNTELSNVAQIFAAMEESLLFPDGVHPGREAHEQLSAEILDFMNKTNR